MREGRGSSHRGRLLCGLAAFLLLPASASAADVEITAEKQIEPRVIELTISTPAFAEPTHVDVDLPVGYDEHPKKRWPVTYVLAGTQNTYRSFNTVVDGVGLTKDYPSIVVSPNGDSGYWSDWFNGGAGGPPMYETYVIDQLIPLIDQRFRTIPTRAERAVMGISMGGYGALMFAARHPDLFSAAASLSGAVDSNLPANGAVLSFSSSLQGAPPDAIYGPRATEEVRWRGHNPADLAGNLRGLDLQVRTANGTPNPAIGEDPGVDTVSCVVEGGVYMASVSMHDELDSLAIPHLWKDYGAGCHTPPNFKREIVDTLAHFEQVLADPPDDPRRFDYEAIDPSFDIWGWHVVADPKRPLEFLRMRDVGAAGLTLLGSGRTAVETPPLFRGVRRVDLDGAEQGQATPDGGGRIRFDVDLGEPNSQQQYTAGATTAVKKQQVRFEPWARAKLTNVRVSRRWARICGRAVGGRIRGRISVRDRSGALAAPMHLRLGAPKRCRSVRWERPPESRRLHLVLKGRDGFGHRVSLRRSMHAPANG